MQRTERRMEPSLSETGQFVCEDYMLRADNSSFSRRFGSFEHLVTLHPPPNYTHLLEIHNQFKQLYGLRYYELSRVNRFIVSSFR